APARPARRGSRRRGAPPHRRRRHRRPPRGGARGRRPRHAPVHLQPAPAGARRRRRARPAADHHDHEDLVMTDRTAPQLPAATILGYPRIGPRRDLKRAVESFWAGRSELDDLQAAAADLRRRQRAQLVGLGLGADHSSIPSDFSFYDQVLDAAVTVGAVPPRFAHLLDEDGALDLPGYFTLARGAGELPPLEMTKWFDTNYHYLVPEISPQTEFRFADDRAVRLFLEAAAEGVTTRPVVVGLGKAVAETAAHGAAPAAAPPPGFTPLDRLPDLLPVYVELLHALGQAGAPWVQLDEPALAVDWGTPRETVLAAVERAYTVL